MSERINACLLHPLAGLVGRMVGENGLCDPLSEYVHGV
jgi:hypothetical protein